jgi:uncharacterized protein (DUF58 family)
MNPFTRWFRGKSTSSISDNHRDSSVDVSKLKAESTGIYNTVDELIALQCHARKLDLSRRSPALASTTGNHFSRFRGRGMDYQESRVYQAGDDIRSMDWRVTARAGKPHTKLYQEERERPIVLLVDFSPSMFFGSVKALKSVVASQVAVLLAWATANKGDRIGALLINGKHKEIEPKMGKRGVLNLVCELVKFSDPEKGLANTENSSHLNDELQRLRRIARPGSLVFLIGDFYTINGQTQPHLIRLRQHNDLVAVQIVDPLEQSAPPAGRYAVTDGIQEGILDTQSKAGKSHYNDFFSQHHSTVKELMRKNRIPLMTVSTADNVPATLQKYFGSAWRQAVAGSASSASSVANERAA